MELDVIKEVFCAAHRKEPLKVGSVKSNLGHTDASSGFISIVKAIIAMESGYIPPNMHYNAPNSKTDALTSGKLQVTKKWNSITFFNLARNPFTKSHRKTSRVP